MSTTTQYRRTCAAAAAALIALGTAACGGSDEDGDSDPLSSETTGSAETLAETPTETAAPEGSAAIATDIDDDLGTFLVDGAGMTLYLFTADGEGTPTCYDACAVAWPPMTADTAEVAASGQVDAALIGTVERNEGTAQVTYNGHPLYYYADDEEPGETDGQGVDDAWYVLAPDGSAVTGDE